MRLTAPILILCALLIAGPAAASEGETAIIDKSLKVLTEVQAMPDLQVPDWLLQRAEGIAILQEGVKAGAGVSILSSRAVGTELKAGVLTSLKIKGLPMSRHFYLIRDRRRTISPLCRTLINFLIPPSKKLEQARTSHRKSPSQGF